PAAPGDWLVADDDGVIILPADAFERTLQAGEARAAKEADMMRSLVLGKTTVELTGLHNLRGRT
ncbi:MAG: dimethylmenaquinone methyltransferase, partial [Azospirillum sp.]|nr:dimethylmenaquinone methyltransferase [Azospirillum sp.]